MDEAIKRFVIEFQYITDEPLKRKRHDKYVNLKIGKNSGRLYAIEIDLAALIAHNQLKIEIQQEVTNVFDDLFKTPPNERRRGNYHLAQQAISTKQEQLFASFAGAPTFA